MNSFGHLLLAKSMLIIRMITSDQSARPEYFFHTQ
jgi:hypothetical protein